MNDSKRKRKTSYEMSNLLFLSNHIGGADSCGAYTKQGKQDFLLEFSTALDRNAWYNIKNDNEDGLTLLQIEIAFAFLILDS